MLQILHNDVIISRSILVPLLSSFCYLYRSFRLSPPFRLPIFIPTSPPLSSRVSPFDLCCSQTLIPARVAICTRIVRVEGYGEFFLLWLSNILGINYLDTVGGTFDFLVYFKAC